MSKLSRVTGTTSEILQVFIRDSSSTTGAGLTSLVATSTGLSAFYCRNDQSSSTTITLVAMTAGSFSSGGFVAIDNTGMPGWYQFCPPNAVFTSGRSAAIHLKGATNMAPLPLEIELTAVNMQDSVRMGLSGLPNASPGAANGLVIAGTNAPITFTGSGAAMTLTSTGGNGEGLKLTGNGSGSGIKISGGATGVGLEVLGGGTSGDAIQLSTTSGDGLSIYTANRGIVISAGPNATDHCILLFAGGTGSNGLNIATTDGAGVVIAASGTSRHGVTITGGTGGTSDGLKLVAGTGGVGFRLDTMTASGAVTMTSSSNDINGINVQKINDVTLVGDGNGTPMTHA